MKNLTTSPSTTSWTTLPKSHSPSPPEKLNNRLRNGTANHMRVAIYIRVSDQSQVDTFSLDAQERQCVEYCRDRGWLVVRVYREEGRSARFESIRKRPEFKQMLDDSTRGLYDLVLFHTLDRFSRNLKVLLEAVGLLEQHGVGLVSATEALDWSTAEGRLVARTLGSFSEFFSDMLAKHTRKGIEERARQGKHLGSIPFGYEPCWREQDGERIQHCKPEHPGGIHAHAKEGPVVAKLFNSYSTGTTTLSQLANRLNEDGFRTRNTKKLPDSEGNLVAEPRLFTTASIRGILHNALFTGKIRHRDKLLPGLHEPLVSEEVFQVVQSTPRKNSGRSMTLQARPEREYLLKGLIQCAYCGMPMWAQTYNSGNRYYREHKGSRGGGNCVNKSGSIRCEVPDRQIGRIVGAIVLPESWMDRLLAKIQLADEVRRVNKERQKVERKLKKLGQVYLENDLTEYEEFQRQRRQLDSRLASLVVPGIDAVREAGKLLENLPRLWKKADLGEKHRILMTILEAVYVECKEEKRIVAIKPKPAFRPLFELASTKAGSDVVLLREEDVNKTETPASGDTGAETNPCSWWRRGRVELPVQKIPWSGCTTGLAGNQLSLLNNLASKNCKEA